MSKITIAIPKGRLYEGVREFLASKGICIMSFEQTDRQYFFRDYFGNDINLFIAKPKAIPQLLESGMCQFGFCGKDIMEDSNSSMIDEGNIVMLKDTMMNSVDMVFAINPNVDFNNLHRPIICATEFPNVATKYLVGKKGLSVYTLNTAGSTEGYVHVGADCIIDVCETGETIKANGLVINDILFRTSTCLYGLSNVYVPNIIKNIIK